MTEPRLCPNPCCGATLVVRSMTPPGLYRCPRCGALYRLWYEPALFGGRHTRVRQATQEEREQAGG